MNAQQKFKKAFGAIRSAYKNATARGQAAIVGWDAHNSRHAVSCGFSYDASKVAELALGQSCVLSIDEQRLLSEIALAAAGCFAWRLFSIENAVLSAPQRLAARREIDAYDYEPI